MGDKKKYYRHFKGGKYLYFGEALFTETLEEMVVYQALYGERKVWVRPKKMFFESVEVNGVTVPRFAEISEDEVKDEI